jgi:acyl carrier protein
MGLDAVELVMEVEDRFEISIRDEEASEIRTVDDLVALVEARIAVTRAKICPTLDAFLGLRSDVREVFTSQSLRIRPSQTVASVLTPRKRIKLWKLLHKRLGRALLPLQRPALLFYAILVFVLAIAIAPLSFDAGVLPLSLFVAPILLVLLLLLTMPFRVVPPVQLATFGQLARQIASTKAALAPQLTAHDSQWVFETVRDIIIRQLGVSREAVVPSASFVKDLGID